MRRPRRTPMTSPAAAWLLGVLLSCALAHPAMAQGTAQGPGRAAAPADAARVTADALKGTWVRPDGGYTIEISGAAASGKLEAVYFNPSRLPFAKALASVDGNVLRAFFELQAGGYAGSTYDLTYDAASDRLKGTYYQAVVKQKFDVYFVRK
jgi:hypothetical protein